GVVILLSVFAAAMILRGVIVVPLSRLAGRVRDVAGGEFDVPVEGSGALEVVELGSDVDAMRARIVAELEALQVAQEDLKRSNSELEQFAYVASHDLQEPLRKVASFTGMLQHRYQGQLDERADQYIDFAVDGAKRMQVLINDLLAFSRVGRVGAEEQVVDMDQVASDAVGDLGAAIEEAGAQVTIDGPLPQVRGDRSLLTALLQNLLANAIKFRGEAPPRVRLSSERTRDPDGDGDIYTFTVSDNGIGIAPRYADRIFVIFQRLHPKEEYTGTGIGLAMCRKIVEFHGGRIWLVLADEDAAAAAGATFRFTLPVPNEDTTP
ncbi:sensor histidine kinase, partial [Baekduia sp.]|uniref:sensor histidine kinase n=1 Tax=Baekduia sp. TaxID=2600305 RepID=UPI002E04FB7D|nr:ATP-binding protein [Baekduia sp.]